MIYQILDKDEDNEVLETLELNAEPKIVGTMFNKYISENEGEYTVEGFIEYLKEYGVKVEELKVNNLYM